MPQPCPKCQRPNGSHRETCLYCGQHLEQQESDAPGTSVDEQAIESAVFAALSATPVGQSRSRAQARGPGPSSPKHDLTEVPKAEALESEPVVRENFAEQMLSGVRATLAVEAAGLPMGRRPYVLVVDGRGDIELAQSLASITGLDHVTTRMVAASEWDRPLLWAAEREGLEAMAQKISQQLGLGASVHETSGLARLGTPRAVMSWEEKGVLTTEKPLWMGVPVVEDPGDLMPFEGVTLAVVGQVEIRRFLEQRRGRWSRNKGSTERREISERRVVLLDLHGPYCFLRIVLGVTNFRGAPHFREGSGVLSMKALVEGLPEVFPGIHVEGKRVAHAQGAKAMQDSESERSSFEITGWSAWEEHTRLCRVHRGLSIELESSPASLPT